MGYINHFPDLPQTDTLDTLNVLIQNAFDGCVSAGRLALTAEQAVGEEDAECLRRILFAEEEGKAEKRIESALIDLLVELGEDHANAATIAAEALAWVYDEPGTWADRMRAWARHAIAPKTDAEKALAYIREIGQRLQGNPQDLAAITTEIDAMFRYARSHNYNSELSTPFCRGITGDYL